MTGRVHHESARLTLVGVVTLAVVLVVAAVGTIVQGGGGLPLKDYTTVTAEFRDVGTVKPGQRVSENGVDVGVVTGVELVDGTPTVTLRLEGEREVYADARARIGNKSALGRKHVDLDPGTRAAGPLGERPIPLTRTRGATELGDVLAAFPPPARAGLRTSLVNLGGGVSGRSDDLYDAVQAAPGLLEDASQIARAVASRDADAESLLGSADVLVTELHGHQRALAGLVETSAEVLEAVSVEDAEPLRRSLAQAPATLSAARDNLRKLNPALGRTVSTVRTLRPGVDALVRATPDLRGVLTESGPTLAEARQFADSAVPGVRALSAGIADADPWVGRLGDTLARTDAILAVLAPFAGDAGHLFANHDLLSGRYAPGKHYFSIQLILPGLYNAGLPDPAARQDPYSGPGNAFASSRGR